MRKILAISSARLRQFFKHPSVWVMMLVMPLLFTAIFGSLLSDDQVKNRPHVALVGGGEAITDEVKRLLTENQQYVWLTMERKEAEQQVKERQVIGAVIIEDQLLSLIEANKPLFTIMVQQKSGEYMALVPIVEGIGRMLSTSYSTVKDVHPAAFTQLTTSITGTGNIEMIQQAHQQTGANFRYVDLSSLGFTIMFMMFGISTAASSILEERREGTWSRILTTPARKIEILIGYLLSFFLVGWIQFGILMLAMSLFFGVNWGNLLYLIPFASLLIITIVGFGLMMAGLVRSRQQAGALSAIVIVSTCMIGGVYWPLEITPQFMQMLAKGVPQSWAISGFQEIVGGSLNLSNLGLSSLMLGMFSVIFFSTGLTRIKFE